MRRQTISKGFSVGLQIWLLFLISLYWLGYSAEMSIALGAIGGLASGLIVDWWGKEEKTEPDTQPAADEDSLADQTKARKKRRQSSGLKQRSQKRKQQQQGMNWRLFGRKPSE